MRRQREARKGSNENLLRVIRQVRATLEKIEGKSQAILATFKDLPEDEVEAMTSAEANLFGALESLVGYHIVPFREMLCEVAGLLEQESVSA